MVYGGREFLDTTIRKFIERFPNKVDEIKQWHQFAATMPNTDDVVDYLNCHDEMLHVPLKREMFGVNKIDQINTFNIKGRML